MEAMREYSTAGVRLVRTGSSQTDTTYTGHPLSGLLGNWQLLYPRLRSVELNSLWPAYAAILLPLGLLLVGIGIGLYLLHRQTRDESDQRATFLRLLAHEFKTPLANLELYSELTRQANKAGEVREYMLVMSGEFTRLKRLINNAIHAQGDADSRILQMHTQDVGSYLQQLVTPFKPRLNASDTNLSVRCHVTTPLHLSGQVLETVVINLLDNLIKYAPGHPAVLSCTWEENMLHLYYHDKGPGIPVVDCAQLSVQTILKPGVTSCDSLPNGHSKGSTQPGFGLGLYVCQRLITLAGGTIDVKSSHGLIIRIAIPALQVTPHQNTI